MPDTDSSRASRRKFMQIGVVALATGLAGAPRVAAAQTQVENDTVRSAPVLVGAKADRPEPDSSFFDDKTRYAYVYQPTDAATKWVLTDQDDQWTDLSSDGIWSDTDGDGLAELPNHDGVAINALGVILDASNDVETEHLGNASHVPHSLTHPNLAVDTWRTPSPDRSTIVTVTFELNPSSVSSSRVDIEVDESGGTTPDYSHPSEVPGALSESQFRAPPTVIVPPGGSYQFNEVSAGSGTSVVAHTEQTL